MLKALVISITLLGIGGVAAAQPVHVDGYYRRDGTYVRPHTRSAPDGDRSNNYGPRDTYTPQGLYTSPYNRDHDRDGIPNQYDRDDDNDGRSDNNDNSQYGRSSESYSPWR